MALVPSASSLWTGDPTLEPLLEEMHKECEGKLNPKECVALLRKAEWRLPLGIALGTVELQTREIKAITGAHADTKTELAEYNEDRLAHDAMIEEQAMINAHAYSNNQEVEVFRVNDIKVKQYVARVAAAEAAAIAAEVRAVAAETAVMDADDRQDAAVAGYVAECERLQAEVDRREELRDANVKLELELAELRLGGRSEKMAIADAYEEELAMSRLLWEMAGPSDDREVWKEANTRQLDAVGETLAQQLDDARGAYGTLVAELWEHNARAQSLARALGVVEEYSHVEQLAEEARRVKVGPADVDRIARELARMENAEQASSNAAHAASKNLAAATAVVDEVTARVAQLEAEIAALEEEHPGIFEMKDPAEAKENGGKLTPEEIGAADLMSRFHNTRAELERAVAVQEVAQQHLKLCDDEHARTTLGMQELRRERKHWRDGPTLPVRIEAARETEKELSDTYEATAANMAQMHKQIRWWCGRLAHPLADLAVEYHPLAESELINCADKYFAKATRLHSDLEKLVRELKAMNWVWSRGTDRLFGWQHDLDLRALLEAEEPVTIEGNTSETGRPRLLWAQEHEMKLIHRKQEAERQAKSVTG